MLPVLKWAGGKRRLLSELMSRLPEDWRERRYVEPFCGGAALFWALSPRPNTRHPRAWLGDRNSDLIEFYKVVRDEPQKLIAATRRLVARYKEEPKQTYYAVRDAFNKKAAVRATMAARLLFLNKTCFNGLWRVNKKGRFNVPMGRYKDPKILDADAVREASRLLQGVVLSRSEFDAWQYGRNEFIYFDPPYVPVSDTANFTGYASGGFGEEDQRRLASLFRDLSDKGIPCMLSNSDTPLVHELYEGYRIDIVHAARSVNSKASKRNRVREVIVRNYG